MDGYYTNTRVPFYKSIRMTAQLPKGHTPFSVYTIVRGQENVPLVIGGYDLTTEKPKLVTYSNHVEKASLQFHAIVNQTKGAGFQGNAKFTYLEGCFHFLTPYQSPATSAQAALGLSGNFPGLTLSTGYPIDWNTVLAHH